MNVHAELEQLRRLTPKERRERLNRLIGPCCEHPGELADRAYLITELRRLGIWPGRRIEKECW